MSDSAQAETPTTRSSNITMLEIKPMAGALGAEIHGLDLSQDLSSQNIRRVRELLNEYEVIFFRDQDISPARQRDLALCFGPLQTHPAYETVAGFPEVTILESTAEKPTKIERWHSDMTFRQHPPMGTVLRSVIIPAKGGDTLWASKDTSPSDAGSSVCTAEWAMDAEPIPASLENRARWKPTIIAPTMPPVTLSAAKALSQISFRA